MRTKKDIQVGLDLSNYTLIYQDPENTILDILRKKFINKCYQGCYIVDINRIVQRSECRINQDGEPSFGTISVVFEAEIIVYSPGEIITGCEFKKRIEQSNILCASEYANIYINSVPLYDSIRVGQIIPICVVNVKYEIGGKISINGIIFIPSKPLLLSYPLGEVKDNRLIANLQETVDEEEKLSKACQVAHPELYKFFDELFHIGSTKAGTNIFDYIKNPTKPWGVKKSLNTLDIFPADSAEGRALNELTPKNTLVNIVQKYVEYKRLVRESVIIYKNKMDEHNNIWMIYKMVKARS